MLKPTHDEKCVDGKVLGLSKKGVLKMGKMYYLFVPVSSL